MKIKVISILFVLSLLGNALFLWDWVNQRTSGQNVSVEYSSSIEMVNRSEQMVHQAMQDTGAKQTSQLFQAYHLLITAQLMEKNYEQDFSQQGIIVTNLTSFLDDESEDLSLSIGQQLSGKSVNQKDIQMLDNNLLTLLQTMPKKYEQGQAFKDAFAKIHHYGT